MVLWQSLRAVSVLAFVVAALAGCSDDTGDSGTQPPPTTATPTSTPTGTTTTTQAPSADLAARIEEAKQLAVRDHDADEADLVVNIAETVTWPDSAYGCPLVDRTYEPGPFPGYRIVLDHDARSYTYTAGEDTVLKECHFLE